MKKRYLVMILILCVTFGVVYSLGKNSTNKTTDVNTIDPRDQKISELSDKISELTEEKQNEELRKAELLALQDPEIVYDKCREVGQLITYESSVTYSDIIKETSFWGSKEMTLKLIYNFGITYDLNQIEVDGFYNDKVVIRVYKDKLILKYLELDMENSDTRNSKSWLSKKFTTEDQEIMMKQATSKTRQLVEDNKEIFDTGMLNLKEQLKSLTQNLGYSDCIVEEY